MSGVAGIITSCLNQFRFVVYGMELGAVELVLVPLAIVLHSGPYFLRYVRLLVMYHPEMRGHWRGCLKESVLVRALAASFGIIELIIWSLSLAVGVGRSND